jgi:hypothetical protein
LVLLCHLSSSLLLLSPGGNSELASVFSPAEGAAADTAAAGAAACKAVDLAVRGLSAMLRSGQQLPETSGSFLRDAVENVATAAERGVQLQAADLYSLGVSCTKLAAAAGNSPKAAYKDLAADMLSLTQKLAETIQQQHASKTSSSSSAAAAAPPAVVAGSSSSSSRRKKPLASTASSITDDSSSSSRHGSGPVLAALLWDRVLHRLGKGYVAAGSSIAIGQTSQQPAGSGATVAPTALQRAADDNGGHATYSWAHILKLGAIGLRVLAEQLLPALQLPGVPGCEEACSAAQQQLAQQCKQLQAQSDSLTDAANEAELQLYLHIPCAAAVEQLPQGLAAAVSEYSQQLLQFGEVLCAQLPVPLCCNNPGCESVAGASEQLLVAGKGSVCSRCK